MNKKLEALTMERRLAANRLALLAGKESAPVPKKMSHSGGTNQSRATTAKPALAQANPVLSLKPQ